MTCKSGWPAAPTPPICTPRRRRCCSSCRRLLGALGAAVTSGTDRGRRPFRPGPDWANRLGELAYGVFLLADQTGVDVAHAVELTAQHLELKGEQAKAAAENGWPFGPQH